MINIGDGEHRINDVNAETEDEAIKKAMKIGKFKKNDVTDVRLDERNYAQEYERYQGTPEQIARRSSRNKARRVMGDKVVKGMDVGHKDNNPMNNDPSNLRNEDPSDNRREPRLRERDTKQDKDIKSRDGTQPAKYYAKDTEGDAMSKSTKQARARHFDKKKKGPAPGDASATTKPSKHTQKFKQMYGEKDIKIPLELLKLYNKGMAAPAGSSKHKEIMKQIDDMRKKLGIKEVLGKNADMGDYIDDFQKSDAPQFKGKSKEKRKDMAIAAYLDKKDKNEEVDMDIYHLDEKIEGLVTKAKKSGMPYGILKKVYDRGMAAYKTGHRPGTTAQQWAFARVNSFVTKSSGTWGKADKDLADKVRASEEVEVQETELGMIPKKKRKGHEVLGPESVQEWFESNQTRASYQLRHGEDWWWKLQEVKESMLEKTGACCDDCAEEVHEETELKEKGPCWDGFKQVGMKMKGGKRVPNCVPESWTQEDIDENLRKVKGTDNLYEPKKMTKFARTKSMIDYLKTRDKKDADKRKKDKNTSDYKMRMFNQKMENAWGEITEKDAKSGKELNNPTRGDVKKYKVYVKNDKGNVVKVEFGDPNMSIKRDDPEARKNFRARHNCDQKKDKTTAGYWSCKFWSTKSVSDLMKG